MRIGVDSGGTFTDVVAIDGAGNVRVAKIPSTAAEPERAVLDGIARVGGDAAAEVTHGSTVATNALLERSGGPTALVTTAGFEDVIELGRQSRPELYALEPEIAAPLIEEGLRVGAAERIGPRGEVIAPLTDEECARVAAAVKATSARSAAVCLLHSYASPEHERRIGAALARLDLPVSLSSEILPEHREYERTATTCADAYVAPVMGPYLERLAAAAPRLRVMLSSGGAASWQEARRHPVRTLLSGPAAGVVGARAAAARAGVFAFVSFDMGGTSTDVCLVEESGLLVRGGRVAEVPIAIPSLPVHTVGAGGGSIARRDEGGALKIGPRSAGAWPGPACYGRGGTSPTVTDAALLLGRLPPSLLDGALLLDRAAAEGALAPLARAIDRSVDEAARGVIAVAVAVIARAIRSITAQRGRDPRDLTLVAFGGAGPMFACEVADALGMGRVLVPTTPGLLCALGALGARGAASDHAATRIGPVDGAAITETIARLEAEARARLDGERVAEADRRIERRIDLRYRGQSYELAVEIPLGAVDGAALIEGFHRAHQGAYGFASRTRAVEAVTVRVSAHGGGAAAPALPSGRTIGAVTDGPARLEEYSATPWIAEGWRATVDRDGALLIARR